MLPRVLIGSSQGGQHVAGALEDGLRGVADVTRWREGEAAPSARSFDAAVFVLCHQPAQGVLLRLGVFLGVLGRERILVCPAFDSVELPAEVCELTIASHPGAVLEHLRRLAASAPPVGSAAAKRRRRSLGTAHSTSPEHTFRIADISVTGALLEAFGELPEHLRLDLTLHLENGAKARVAAEVVRLQYPQWGRIGGVGVRFLRFEDGSRDVLESYLESAQSFQSTGA